MINRKFFFDRVRTHLFDGRLLPRQVNGLTQILSGWEKSYAKADDRFLAYALATTHHETDRTMWPIEEYGKGRNKEYGIPHVQTGKVYYGRGFVQLTWWENYVRAGKELKVDLAGQPELALRLDIATNILFAGMLKGWFTTRKLSDYFNGPKQDWVKARRIINRLDQAKLISSYGKEYYAAISHTT